MTNGDAVVSRFRAGRPGGRFTRTPTGRVFDVRTGRFTSGGRGRGPTPTTAEEAAQASLIDRDVVAPTPAEVRARASLVDRRPPAPRIITTETRVTARAGAAPVIISAAQKEPLRRERVIQRPREDRNIFEDIRTSLVGRPGTEQRGIPFTGRGGVFQRVQSSFFGPLRAGTEFGQAVGGVPGRAAGALAGAAIGGGLGILEGGFGTALRLGFEAPVTRGALIAGADRPTAETAGQLAGGVAGFVSLPRGAIGAGGRLLRGTGQIARQTPQALLAAESVIGKGRSVFAQPTLVGRAAQPLQSLISGAEAGARGAPTASIFLSRAERAGRIGGRAVLAGRQAITRPVVNIPLLFGGAAVAPEIAESVAVAGTTQQFRRQVVSTSKGQLGLDLASEEVRRIQASRGPIAQIGGELSLGALEGRERIGGVSTADVRKAAERGLIGAGFSRREAEKFAPEAAVLFKARQIGGIAGFTGVSIGTEVVGARTIGPLIERGLIGQTVRAGTPRAFRRTLGVVAPTLPRFAALGAIEGIETVAISELAQRRARGVRDLPRRVVEAPGRFALGGVFGAGSAAGLGGLTIGGGVFRAFRGGRSPLGRGVEAGALSAGLITDVFEKSGDDIARFFGKVEPRLRIRTLQAPDITGRGARRRGGIVTPTETRGRVRTPSLFPAVGLPESIIERAPTITPAEVPTITPTEVPVPILDDFIGLPQDVTQPDITQDIPTQVPVSTFIGITTPIGVPVSKAGFPPLFPAAPFGGGRGRRRGRARRTFFDEFTAATSLLGPTLVRRGRQIAREQRRSIFDLRPRRQRRRRSKSRSRR